MQVRPYHECDREAVIALWRECGLVVPRNDPTKDIERNLAVEQRLCERGCPRINLQVRASNPAVIDFYRAPGYCDDAVVGLGKPLESDR